MTFGNATSQSLHFRTVELEIDRRFTQFLTYSGRKQILKLRYLHENIGDNSLTHSPEFFYQVYITVLMDTLKYFVVLRIICASQVIGYRRKTLFFWLTNTTVKSGVKLGHCGRAKAGQLMGETLLRRVRGVGLVQRSEVGALLRRLCLRR